MPSSESPSHSIFTKPQGKVPPVIVNLPGCVVEVLMNNWSTDVELLLSERVENISCDKCGSTKVYKNYIDSAEVVHCVCECGKEWVE